MTADAAAAQAAREIIRTRERAIWTDVERVGRELRAAEAPKQAMTQADRDAAQKKPTEGVGSA
ncbi:MAG TPA: hypothetical protein VKI44_23585 [Acetobacteraceae bacterium]|nr:hypothetical protein [Acetobacteraceae bacterium]